jgi:putative DNA primase/helicase
MEYNFMCFSRFRGRSNSILTKQYCRDDNGGICKVRAPYFSNGTAETIRIEKISHLENVIDNLGTNECISTGVFDGPSREIVAKDMLDEVSLNAGVRSRTSEHMVQPPRGIALLDHDINPYIPDHLKCHTPGELMSKMQKAIPGLGFVAYSGSGSCSSGITITATNKPYHGGGLHVYIPVKGVDLRALRRYMEVKLWNADLGYIAFARNGAMLKRCIIDLSVLSPERLIYEADPILGDGLSRRPREWQHRGGIAFSGNFSLTQDEIGEYERRVASARRAPENKTKAEELAEIYHEGKVDALAEHNSVSREEAKRLIPRQTAAERNGREYLLHLNDIVEINGNKLFISELLERGSEFDKTAMPDPIEGSAYGTTTAKFYFNNGQNPCIHSFAHGLKTVYKFEDNNKAAVEGKINHRPPGTGFDIDQAQPLDPSTFPNQKLGSGGKIRLLATIPNVKHLLKGYDITARYDVIRKEDVIQVPGVSGTSENVSNMMIEYVNSLATLNGIASNPVPRFVSAIANENLFNPVATWISSSAWDGVDRLPEVYGTLVVREDFPMKLKEVLIKRWLLSAVAAALMPIGFHTRGVLVLQGRQLLGKTSWIRALIPDSLLRDSVILTGHHLDPSNKDSMTTAIKHWIVELGELDSSFRKDVARLKGFLTSDRDKVRRPYARTNSEYQRRTVMCASVNEETFLVDPTGNSRFWTLPVIAINYQHGIDMQQVFAQLAVDLDQGAEWWLTPEEDAELEVQNSEHQAVSSLEEMILPALDFDMSKELWRYKSATEVLQSIGIEHPNNNRCRECGRVLRDRFGAPKKIQGIMKWKVPLK